MTEPSPLAGSVPESQCDEFGESTQKKYSTFHHISYGLGGFLDNFLTGAFSLHVFFFYETELGVPGVPFMLIAFILYGLWNMFNDPLAGYISDRPYKFVKKWGRRFPLWIVSAIPYSIIYLLIFSTPGAALDMNAWIAFGWLLLTICLFDWVYSFWQTNWLALFPVKFRNQTERARVGAMTTYAGQFGIAMGMLLPSLFINFEDISSYFVSASVIMVIGLVISLLMIPGMREDKELKELAEKCVSEEDQIPLGEAIKIAFKSKNFLSYAMVYLAQLVLMTLALGSLDYYVKYILGSTDADLVTLIGAGLLIGGLVSTPFWEKYGRKHGNRKAYLIGSLAPAIALAPFMFLMSLVPSIIVAVIVGVSIGAVWTLMYPAYADVIDEIVLKTGKRNEGVFTGIRTIFGRLPFVLQAIFFSIIHHVTGFNEDPYSASAQFGIRIHMVLIPIIFYFIGFLAMWKYYDLTPEKIARIKVQIKELDL